MATLSNPSHLRQNINHLAEKAVEIQYRQQPDIWKPYGHPGREKSIRDAGYHLAYLAEAVEANAPTLFSEYLAWVKVLFTSLNFSDQVLPATLECLREVLQIGLSGQERETALRILAAGAKDLEHSPLSVPTYLSGNQPLDTLSRQYLDLLLQPDRRAASEIILAAVQSGVHPRYIYTQVFERTQREIGRLWQTNQISVAQEHFCTAATQMIMSQLYPYIFSGERKNHRVVVACVGGELHEIGARMVADFFEMDGWDSYFLGANTPPGSVLQTVLDRQADILAISATMTFHVNKVTDIIHSVRENAALSTKILVGGYPFNLSTDLWRKVGADGYAIDADSAVKEAQRLLSI